MSKTEPKALETTFRNHLSATRTLYTTVKGIQAGDTWRQARLDGALAAFDQTHAALKAQALAEKRRDRDI